MCVSNWPLASNNNKKEKTILSKAANPEIYQKKTQDLWNCSILTSKNRLKQTIEKKMKNPLKKMQQIKTIEIQSKERKNKTNYASIYLIERAHTLSSMKWKSK